ncbi:MAG: HEAT repeat domain-containing protein [Anaerolineales bacterium]
MAELGALIADLQSQDDSRAELAASALAEHGEAALTALGRIVNAGNAEARWWTMYALAGFPQDRAGELLVAGLEDPEMEVRHCAALALCKQPYADSIQPLLGLLGSQDGLLSRLAANALVAAGRAAVPGLLATLQEDSPQVKGEATRALALIGDTRAIPSFFHLLESESGLVEHWASQGLAKLHVGMTFYET